MLFSFLVVHLHIFALFGFCFCCILWHLFGTHVLVFCDLSGPVQLSYAVNLAKYNTDFLEITFQFSRAGSMEIAYVRGILKALHLLRNLVKSVLGWHSKSNIQRYQPGSSLQAWQGHKLQWGAAWSYCSGQPKGKKGSDLVL